MLHLFVCEAPAVPVTPVRVAYEIWSSPIHALLLLLTASYLSGIVKSSCRLTDANSMTPSFLTQ